MGDEDVYPILLDPIGDCLKGERADRPIAVEFFLKTGGDVVWVFDVAIAEGLEAVVVNPVQKGFEGTPHRVVAEVGRDEPDPNAPLGVSVINV